MKPAEVIERTPSSVSFFLACAPAQKGNRKVIRRRNGRRGPWSNGAMAAALSSIGVAAPKASGGMFISSNDEDKAAEVALVRALRAVAPPEPWRGVMEVSFTIVYPVPRTFTDEQAAEALAGTVRPTSTGYHHHDRGNPLKLVEDAMQAAGLYVNDSQVCEGPVRKVFGPVPGYKVRVEELAGLKTCPKGKRRAPAKRKAKA